MHLTSVVCMAVPSHTKTEQFRPPRQHGLPSVVVYSLHIATNCAQRIQIFRLCSVIALKSTCSTNLLIFPFGSKMYVREYESTWISHTHRPTATADAEHIFTFDVEWTLRKSEILCTESTMYAHQLSERERILREENEENVENSTEAHTERLSPWLNRMENPVQCWLRHYDKRLTVCVSLVHISIAWKTHFRECRNFDEKVDRNCKRTKNYWPTGHCAFDRWIVVFGVGIEYEVSERTTPAK